MADAYTSRSRPRRRWGRRLLITLLVFLILVGIALVVLDRLGVSFAEREIADRVSAEVADQQATSAYPVVTIDGVPFLTQVVSGSYQRINIRLRDFAARDGEQQIRMPVLDIHADDVRAPLETLRTRQGDITAGTVTGTGTLDYATVAELVNRDGVKLAERDGKLAVTAPLDVLGQSVTVNGTAVLTVVGEVLQIRFQQLTGQGLPALPLVQNLLNAYAKQISVDVRLPALPLDLAVQKVEPRPEGLLVTAGATNVPLNSGGL